MIITKEKLDKLKKLAKNLKKQEEYASELLRIAQDRFKDREIEFMKNGQKIKCFEKDLWQTIYYVGFNRNIPEVEVMKKKHKEVFKAYQKQQDLANEYQAFVRQNFGFDIKAFRIEDYFEMIEAMIDYKLNNK